VMLGGAGRHWQVRGDTGQGGAAHPSSISSRSDARRRQQFLISRPWRSSRRGTGGARRQRRSLVSSLWRSDARRQPDPERGGDMKVWLLGGLAQGGDMEVRSSMDGRRKEAATIPRLVVVEV
jgi:hypothetical protein